MKTTGHPRGGVPLAWFVDQCPALTSWCYSMRLGVAGADVSGRLDAAVIAKAKTIAILACHTDVEWILDFTSAINQRKDLTMGDKGGKKDKDKSKKQKTAKHEQKVKGAQEKNRPKS